MGQTERGLTLYNQAIIELAEFPDSVEMANVHINLGHLYTFHQPDRSLAMKHLKCALHILEKIDSPGSLAWCYAYLAIVQSDSTPQAAIEYGQRSLAIAERYRLPNQMATANMGIGSGYRYLGDWAHAAAAYEQVLQICQVTGIQFSLGIAYSYLAELYPALGKLTEAIEAARQALAIWEKLGHPFAASWIAPLLNAVYGVLGKIEESQAWLERALRDAPVKADAYYHLIYAYAVMGHPAEAMAALRQGAACLNERRRQQLRMDPGVAALRDSPEFWLLLERTQKP
jgi:tetratricopeptide (TPR) repeat protein